MKNPYNKISRAERVFARRTPKFFANYKSLQNFLLQRSPYLHNSLSVIWVDPRDIDYHLELIDDRRSLPDFDYPGHFSLYYELAGVTMAGDWDLRVNRISQFWKFRDMVRRFSEEAPWELTEHYRRLISYNSNSLTPDQALKMLGSYDRLYASIRDVGVLPAPRSAGPMFRPYDDICVSIGRNGQLLFGGSGWHRFSIARIIGISSIPVRVQVRHTKWVSRLRSYCAASLNGDSAGFTFLQESKHPDCISIKKNLSCAVCRVQMRYFLLGHKGLF